jgi:uncharacterized protein
MPQDDLELIQRVYRRWADGDLRAGRELLDIAVTTVWAAEFPTAGIYHGPREHGNAMREWLAEWDDFELAPEDFIEAGGSVVVPFRVRARGRGSGALVERSWAHVWTLRNGKVVRFEVHLDLRRALEAAGGGGPPNRFG